jgi:hypothetical protein
LSGCSSSSVSEERPDSDQEHYEEKQLIETSEHNAILYTAIVEQENTMYSPEVDSTYLYWIDSSLIILNGSTKCNIFALNVLHLSGYKTPPQNALSIDLYDTSVYKDIFPVVELNSASKAMTGDLIVWPYHVIIFEKLLEINSDSYARGYWAGTRQADNGNNIKNNVCYGKYKLVGEFVVRRPLKKSIPRDSEPE